MKNICRAVSLYLFFALVVFGPYKLFAQTDLGAIGLASPVQKSCFSTAETVSVKIRNYSSNSHSFATTPVTVNISVTGPNAISFPSIIVNTGTLAAGDSLPVVISTNYNMIAPGTYVFNASTIAAGDVNTANDAMPQVSRTVTPLSVTSTTPGVRCGPGTITLGASPSTGGTIQWFSNQIGGTIAGSGNSFTTPILTSTTSYYATAWNGGSSSNVGIGINDFAICGFPASNAVADKPLRFTTTKAVVINSAYIIPQASTITVALRLHNSFSDIVTKTFNFSAAQIGSPQQILLDWTILAPGNYQLTNSVGGLWGITSMGCGYPFVAPSGGMIITGSAPGSNSISNTTTYNSFFQINITEGCASQPATVVAQVNEVTAITQQPVSVSTCAGASVNLVVKAQGVNLVYQWRKNGVNIANSNNDTLTFSPATVDDAGNYDVVINGLCGSTVTSAIATVNVSNGNAWTGMVSTDWNNSANWCAGIPSSTSNVTIFGGTPFQPAVNSSVDVRTLTLSTGAVLTLMPNASLNIYGDFVNNGSLSAADASVIFKGSINQNIGGMTVGNATVNGNGITLTGNMQVNTVLSLTSGNIILGNHDLSIIGSVQGTSASHVVTNGSGVVISKNISVTPVTVPVGPTATSYNPVVISNGGGKDYSVKVQTGLNPAISNPGRAVNRTWSITPNSALTSPANITFQFEDAHMNSNGVSTNTMEIGVHNGNSWMVVTPNATPTGSSNARQVVCMTNQFGTMAVSNIGGISWITATPTPIDGTMNSISLVPTIVESSTILKVTSARYEKLDFSVMDMQGRLVMRFEKSMLQGQHQIPLQLSHLQAGMYTITATSDKGTKILTRFIKK